MNGIGDSLQSSNQQPAHSVSAHSAHHGASAKMMLFILITLLFLTALTVYTAEYVNLGAAGNLAVAMVISLTKGTLVVLFFMGLLYDRALNAVVLFFCLLAILSFMGFTLIDMGSRGMVNASSAGFINPPTVVFDAKMRNPEVAQGYDLFKATCASCHGTDAKGLPGLGKDMATSDFIASTNDSDLLKFIKHGRDPGDPMNTTGVAMPPRGGNPTLDDNKLKKIITFVRIVRPYAGEPGEGSSEGH